MEAKAKKRKIEVKSITDVPNEVIYKNIMVHLYSDDVCSFGLTCERFKAVAEDVLEKRGK